MITFPNGKINIGLQVTNKRNDGYHDIETIFYPVKVKDVLEIIQSPAFSFNNSGLAIEKNTTANLCEQAYYLLKKDFDLPPVQIHLHKAIPIGAGLGGGSADAAFCLQLLNNKFNLQLGHEQLSNYALKLGSDCPFFLVNEPCFATGRGEKLKAVSLDLSAYKILLINPGIHIDTAWAFSQLLNINFSGDQERSILQPVITWKESLYNVFEKPVFEAYPEIAAIKSEMYLQGALYAAMSGSGSSVYGIYTKNATPVLKLPVNYFLKWV